MKIAVIVIAFGEPYVDLKLKILQNNIQKVKNTDHRIDVHLNLYTLNKGLEDRIYFIDPNIKINSSTGHLMELLRKFNNPAIYADYDRIILLFDDVEISDINFDDMFQKQDEYQLDLISPKIISSNFPYLNSANKGLKYSVILEFFFYVFSPSAYTKYWNFLYTHHKTMWGYDLLIFYGIGLKAAIYYNYSCKHHIHGSYDVVKLNPASELNELERDMGISLFRQINPLCDLDVIENHPIIIAYYGSQDITLQIRELYNKGIYHFCSENFPDPNLGFHKYLVIIHSVNGKKYVHVAPEKMWCKLSHHNNTIKLENFF